MSVLIHSLRAVSFLWAFGQKASFFLTLRVIRAEMKKGSRATWPVLLSWQPCVCKVLLLLLSPGLCFSCFQHLFVLSFPLWWATFLSMKRGNQAHFCELLLSNWGCLCKKKATYNSGAHRPLLIPGAHHSQKQGVGPLTGCFFRVVAHEALPCSCRFTEAKHVKEPHFFQMELYLVQILFEEHKAQGT